MPESNGRMFEGEGFILAGGASRRMGEDKAQLRFDGQTFVERAAGALAAIVQRISIVSARHTDATWKWPRVADIYKDCGALGGLHAALAHARAPWAAVVSCDLPFVTGELFTRLAALHTEAFDVIIPVQMDGRLQPLCALYDSRTCLERARQLLRSGELRLHVLLRQLRARRVLPDELADLTGAPLFFTNVNTPEDYALALAAHAAKR